MGGFLPRFAKTGELLATPEQDSGKRIILDSGSPVLNCRIREDHYGVLTEALVIDKRQNVSYSVKNPEMIAKGGQCRRVIYTPGAEHLGCHALYGRIPDPTVQKGGAGGDGNAAGEL